jgi:hypothetical protein
MTKLLALVFILNLQSVSAMENVAIKSLRLSLWYQGLEKSGEIGPDFFEGRLPEQKKNVAPELIEMAQKFSNTRSSEKK